MRSTLKTLKMALGLSLLWAFPAAAQPADSEAPSFGEIIDVRVINLEVVVTDGKERVRALKSEDFRLLVDGQEVPIEYFTEVEGGRAASPAASSEAAAVPALRPGEAVGTRFLVFIDDSFTVRPRRNRVLRKLAEQLPFMGPEDHMAVVAFDGREIEALTSWTRSLPELERVFEQAQQRPAYGLQRAIGRSDTLDAFYYGLSAGRPFFPRAGEAFHAGDPFAFGYGPGGPYYGYGYGAPRGSLAYSETARVLDAATSVLRGFAKPPGRKVMLLLSGGWSVGNGGSFSPEVDYGAWGTDRLLRPLVDTANRLGYTLYPVDVQGVRSHFGGAQFATAGEAAYAASLSRSREWVEEGALLYLARETGGRALLDGASLKALERAVDDTRSYYWLGFTPTWRENDRRHKVKVEVRRKGLKVRSRASFSDLSRQTEVTMLVESAQLFDLPIPGEDAELGVTLGEPQKAGFRKVMVPLRLEIPLDQVTLLPYGDGYVTRLELRVAVTDDRGHRADVPVVPVELRGESAAAGQTGVFELGLKLRRRPHQLLISLHDPASGHIISKRVDFSI